MLQVLNKILGLSNVTKEPSRSLTHSTISGLLWMFSGKGAQAFLQLIVLIILARLLTPNDFGIVSAALIVVNLSEIFSQLGVGAAVVQRVNLETRHICTGITISVVFGILLAAIVSLLAPFIAYFFRMEGLILVLRYISLVFIIHGMAVVAEALLQRQLQFNKIVIAQFISYALGYALIGIVLALKGFGFWALVGATMAQAAIKTLILLYMQPNPRWFYFELSAFKDLVYFGAGHTTAKICNFIANQGDYFVVGRWLGVEALGFYGRAYQLMIMPAMYFGQILDNVLFPVMSKIQNDRKRLADTYKQGSGLIALIVLPISVIMYALAPEIIYLLLGPSWGEVVIPFKILAIGMLFRTSYRMGDCISRATGAVYRRAWRQAIYALCVVVGSWIGQHWGLTGVAIAIIGAITVNFILMTHLSLGIANITWRIFLDVHLSSLLLSLIVSAEVLIVSSILRNWGTVPLLTLAVTTGLTFMLIILKLYTAPNFFLGKEGIELLKKVRHLGFS